MRGYKKIAKSILVLLIAFFVVPNMVFAAPAPPLSDIQIIAVTSDGNDYIWENITRNQDVANIPLIGEKGYLAIAVYGTYWENYPLVYNIGDRISTTVARPSDWITDASGIVIGEIVYLEFDLDEVSTGRFTVSASNYIPPYQTRYDHLYIYVE